MRGYLALLGALLPLAAADVITRIPDAAPPGFEEWISPIVVPAKNVSGDGDWASAVRRAREFVSQLTLEEKVHMRVHTWLHFVIFTRHPQVNVTTGIDVYGRCVGQTGVRAFSMHMCTFSCSLAIWFPLDHPTFRLGRSLPARLSPWCAQCRLCVRFSRCNYCRVDLGQGSLLPPRTGHRC
jgi:hypothetical protein